MRKGFYRTILSFVALIALVISLTPQGAFAQDRPVSKVETGVVVKTTNPTQLGSVKATSIPNVYLVSTPPGMETQVARAFAAQPGVQYAEPSTRRTAPWIRHASAGGAQPLNLWHVQKTDSDLLHQQRVVGNKSAIMAIIDTGTWAHPLFSRNLLPGFDVTTGKPDGRIDIVGHGTHVAGIAYAICPECSILPIRVFDDFLETSDLLIAQAIRFATDQGSVRTPVIINLSLGGAAPSRTLCSAVEYAQQRNAVVVAAAGNESQENNFSYPARCNQDVVVVTATNQDDELAFFTNYGQTKNIIGAPGYKILSTVPPPDRNPNDIYFVASGTSMAAPVVTGALALRQSTVFEPLFSSIGVLFETADQIVYGKRLNAARMMGASIGRPVIAGTTVSSSVLPRSGGTVMVSSIVRRSDAPKVFLERVTNGGNIVVPIGKGEDGARMTPYCNHDVMLHCATITIPSGIEQTQFNVVVVASNEAGDTYSSRIPVYLR